MTEQKVEAVERALLILEAFQEGEEELPLSTLALKTGLYKSTILRLCASLERFGYLRRGENGSFRLGPTLWRLGSLYRRSFDLGEQIRPELRRLVEATQETASFYVREGEERICLYRLNSPRAVRHHLDEGARLPLHSGAAGRVLLAFDGAQDEISQTIRGQGFGITRGDRDPEIAAAAVPVLDNRGRLRGALSVSALLNRFDSAAEKRALDALQESAERLRGALSRD
ncbi:IclR family transcriptional regulator [Telmatospirillum sp. J64-1]|uniref:IclR family transcriptional regulator n=1 Tax=Telmatospirillum sp. J64-1 TaxID=2502183 RepID=UPI00115D68F9|nr:IclR family transcriptional regulator [Telmatospirillum sp. J64-1]